MSYDTDLRNDKKVIVSSSALVRILSKKIVRVIGFLIIALGILYLCFAATIVRFVPSTSGTGIQLVKNITSEGGVLDDGKRIMVNPEQVNDHSIESYLQHAFIPSGDYMMVETVYGPYGEFDYDEETGEVIYENEATGLVGNEMNFTGIMEERNDTLLGNEYIALCVSGDCVEGEAYIVDDENITGEVVNIGELDPISANPVPEDSNTEGGE